jgi:hypothetical protein
MTAYREPDPPPFYEDVHVPPKKPKRKKTMLKNACYLGSMLQSPLAIGMLVDVSTSQPGHIGLIVGAGIVSGLVAVAAFIFGSWSYAS